MDERPRPDRAPLLPAAPALGAWLCLAAGYVIADQFGGVFEELWFAGAVAAGVFALAFRRRMALIALAIGMTLGGAGYFDWRIQGDFKERAESITTDRVIVHIEGVLREDPKHGPPIPGAFAPFVNLPPVARFTVRADRLIDGRGERRVNANVLVRVNETTPHVRAGDRVRLSGFLTPIRPPMNPGEPDARRWAQQENILGRMSVSARDNVEQVPALPGLANRVRAARYRLVARLRAGAAGWLDDATGAVDENDRGRAALVALLLGDRDDASMRDVSQAMRRTGVAHLLSISGLHLGVLVWLLVMALRGLGVRVGIEAIIVAAVVILYMTLIPVRTPIVRAGIMALAYLSAEAAGRRYHPLAVLAWTGVAVLLWRPLELWSPGFQLSFGVVAAIIVFPPRVVQRLHPIQIEPDVLTAKRWFMRKIEQALIVAACAWLIASPIIAFHFGMFSVIGMIASIVLFPLVVVVLGVGAGAILLAALLPSVAQALGIVLDAIASLLAECAVWLDALPFSVVFLPPLSVWWTLAATGAIAFVLSSAAWRPRRDIGVLALVALSAALHAAPFMRPTIRGLRIDTLSVDDGACHLIRSGKEAMLWDAGSRLLWFGERDLPRALRALNAWPIRTIILSHPNLDHYSAIPDLVEPFGVREIVVTQGCLDFAASDPLGPTAHLIHQLEELDVNLRIVAAGDVVPLGPIALDVLHPELGDEWTDLNEGSLVALARVPTDEGERTALFCGDIERSAMAAIMQHHPNLHPDVMEAPHHGSARPFAIRFVETLDPLIVVQSTGLQRAGDDRWDHVRAERVWRTTALDGAITVDIARSGAIDVSTIRHGKETLLSGASEKSTSTPQ